MYFLIALDLFIPGLAGFPQWEAPAGGNQDKVPRRERFFLLKLQELSKELGEAARVNEYYTLH